jgi:hypothetical protein
MQLITFSYCFIPYQGMMSNLSGKTRSRGEKMNLSRNSIIIHGTQRTENATADPTLRNKARTWKANAVPNREATSNSTRCRESSPSPNLRSSTPKNTTSELNGVGLPRSGSTGSGKKNATPNVPKSTNTFEHGRPSSDKTQKSPRKTPSPTTSEIS